MHAPLYPVHVISLWPHFLLANGDGFCQFKTKLLRSLKSGRAMPESLLRGIRPRWPQTQPKLGTFVGCISQEMSFSMSSILVPNVGANPVPVPSTTQNLNPVLGPSQWSWSSCQPVPLAPPNPNSAHQPQLSQGVFLMLAVPQAQGAAYQPGSYTPAFWHTFPSTSMLQPAPSGTTQ